MKSLLDIQTQLKACFTANLDIQSSGAFSNADYLNGLNDRVFSAKCPIPLLQQKVSYNQQYWYRIFNLFYERFPGLVQNWELDTFYQHVQQFYNESPLKGYLLTELGYGFGEFLASRGLTTQAQIARLDEVYVRAKQGFNLEDVKESGSSDINALCLKEEVFLYAENIDWAIHREESLDKKKKIEIVCKKAFWAFTKRKNQIIRTELNELAFKTLTLLKSHACLAQGLEACAEEFSEEEFLTLSSHLNEWFSFWAEKKWFK